jgi:hypothetical protein
MNRAAHNAAQDFAVASSRSRMACADQDRPPYCVREHAQENSSFAEKDTPPEAGPFTLPPCNSFSDVTEDTSSMPRSALAGCRVTWRRIFEFLIPCN